MRSRGYDIDSPRGGGKSKLADDAGVHRAAVSRLLQRQSMPDLDTMRRLSAVLRVPLRDVLIRSGKLSETDLPIYPVPGDAGYGTAAAPGDGPGDESGADQWPRLSPEEAARRMGVPAALQEMFVKVARQFLPVAEPGET
ncbi:helix-turn-helix transcriptional regulator [Streptomyces sp. SPB162]|uniref:helix-turn-helix domain-containing protein n=1 Tax=Streptomyces sp. SPB162 TaxID=2940560 RepID=UPI002406E7AF|nr:helix-turn-helix transcriptional regulator [Streptomyces sp. SPB162]